jgi:hypothetical protein
MTDEYARCVDGFAIVLTRTATRLIDRARA